MLNKKTKSIETTLFDEQESTASLRKQFNEFMQEVDEKIEKLMNSPDSNTSVHKSMSRNMAGDYLIELKSSMKETPIVQQNAVEEVRTEIYEMQETLRGISYDLEEVRRELKSIAKLDAVKTVNEKTEVVDSSKFQQIN